MDYYIWIVTLGVIVLSAIYWFFIRDDNLFDSNQEPLVLKIKTVSSKELTQPKKSIVKNKDGLPLKILFYSQTGTAEDFARRLGDDANNYGFSPDVMDVDSVDEPESLGTEKLIVFFAATYGEGDPPDNAKVFHTWLMDTAREATLFSGTKFTVFGLGNKTYDQYNLIGQQINKRMEDLGGTRIYDLGLGNDDENIENDFLKWKKSFGPTVCKEFGLPPPGDPSMNKPVFKQTMNIYAPDDVKLRSYKPEDLHKIARWRDPKNRMTLADRNSPILAPILAKRELHKAGSGRSCLHLEISTCDGILAYERGDHIGVYPENEDQMVDDLAVALRLSEDRLNQIVSLHSEGKGPFVGPCTLRAILKQFYDIANYPKKPILRVLAHFTKDEVQKKRLFELGSDDPEKQEEFDNYIVKDNRTIAEVLKDFASIEIPVEHLLEFLPKLQPRFYSISSSHKKHPESVHVTAVVTNWTTPTGRVANGVCTTWMANLALGDKPIRVPSFIRKNASFYPPKSLSTPLIMVGPGTGLAPFRGFLQERRILSGLQATNGDGQGEAILFFGCRTNLDYLYEDELTDYHKDKVLSDLQVAFSRAGPDKVYVQHLMDKPEVAKKIWSLIEKGAHFYVCGDARLMARDVGECLAKIIAEHGKMSREDAEKYISKMQGQGRHNSDVWS